MKILFIGGTGLIGSNFYQFLLNKKVEMDIISRNRPSFILKKKDKWFKFDITKKIKLIRTMNNFYDVIIIGTTPSAKERFEKSVNKDNYSKVNVDGLKNILNFLEKIKFNKIVYLSSGVVYGRNLLTKKNENSKLLLNKTDKLYEYGISKIYAENIIKNYCDVNNVNLLILRIFSIINFKINQYNIGYVINNFIKSSIEQNSINILSNPNNKTCFICNQTNKFCEDLTYDTSENTTDNNSTTIQIDNRIYDVETRNHRIKTTITCWSVITIIILSCIIILIIHT